MSTTVTESLRELVTRLLDEHGWSGREAARRAEQHGYSTSYTTLNSITNGTRTQVSDETLESIAVIFKVPEDDVRAAAGVPSRHDATDGALARLHQSLTFEERQAGLEVYRAYVKAVVSLRASSPTSGKQSEQTV